MLVVIRPPFLASICIGEDISFRGYKYITRGSIAIESNLPLHLEKRPPPTQQKFELNSGFYKKRENASCCYKIYQTSNYCGVIWYKIAVFLDFFSNLRLFCKKEERIVLFPCQCNLFLQ